MLNERSAINKIKLKFGDIENVVLIPLPFGGFFSARMIEQGIMVDNLGFYPFLPWTVFVEVINFLARKSGRAEKGDAISARLGDEGLSLETVEGHVAHVIYGKKVREVIFRRMSSISAILVWAGVCDATPDELILR
jgi:hypothetical protein